MHKFGREIDTADAGAEGHLKVENAADFEAFVAEGESERLNLLTIAIALRQENFESVGVEAFGIRQNGERAFVIGRRNNASGGQDQPSHRFDRGGRELIRLACDIGKPERVAGESLQLDRLRGINQNIRAS